MRMIILQIIKYHTLKPEVYDYTCSQIMIQYNHKVLKSKFVAVVEYTTRPHPLQGSHSVVIYICIMLGVRGGGGGGGERFYKQLTGGQSVSLYESK